MVDTSPLLMGKKQDGREASVLGSSLYSHSTSSLQRKGGYVFLFSLRTSPGLGGCCEEQDAVWGGGWRRCCHLLSTHNTVWAAGHACLAAVTLLKALPISWTLALPRLLTSSQTFQTCCGQNTGPVFISRILRAVVLWWNFFASCDLFWGFLPISRVCCVTEQQRTLAAGKAWVYLFGGSIVFFCFPVGSFENCLNTVFQLILTQVCFFSIPQGGRSLRNSFKSIKILN